VLLFTSRNDAVATLAGRPTSLLFAVSQANVFETQRKHSTKPVGLFKTRYNIYATIGPDRYVEAVRVEYETFYICLLDVCSGSDHVQTGYTGIPVYARPRSGLPC